MNQLIRILPATLALVACSSQDLGTPPAAEYATKPGDTGSPEVQVSRLSERIVNLTEHLKTHAKDFHSRRGLLVLVGQRRGLLDYLKRKDVKRYESLIQRLSLRR